ncbi:oligosaccharide flippase family protein [Methylorubrum sp. POS3]|uniref:oligosaccharide flippase family protein n=1 Tax=Methylorubrum sp. POS3 TaxID=2998492 RepID=UPI00372B3550
MRLAALSKMGALAFLGATEIGVPFVRMIILTRVLGPYEFGFAAALSATYGAVEQITDTSLYRFVLATSRDRYHEALATAHGIALMRGLLVAALFLALSYPVGCGMVSCGDWSAFAWLAPLPLIKSLENLELRVYERDYRYKPQLIASLVSHGCGIAVMLAVGLWTGTHYALIAYLIVQAIVNVGLTHILATVPFRVMLRGPLVGQALRYSLPLMANGLGNAIMTQGDRLLVGAFLGLQTLGLYAVVILTSYVPTSGLFRLLGPVQMAGLINAVDRPDVYEARLRLYARAVPMVAAAYALGWEVLAKSFMPAIFGARFVASDLTILLVGLIVYLRVCRTEPMTAVLLQTGGTAKLAVANQMPMLGLALGALLVWIHPQLESLLAGMVVGEIVALIAALTIVRGRLGTAWRDAVTASTTFFVLPLAVGVLFETVPMLDPFLPRLAVGMGCAVVLLATGLAVLSKPARQAYRPTVRSDMQPPRKQAAE